LCIAFISDGAIAVIAAAQFGRFAKPLAACLSAGLVAVRVVFAHLSAQFEFWIARVIFGCAIGLILTFGISGATDFSGGIASLTF
jgi:multidrug efflux pump subunit AcrB